MKDISRGGEKRPGKRRVGAAMFDENRDLALFRAGKQAGTRPDPDDRPPPKRNPPRNAL